MFFGSKKIRLIAIRRLAYLRHYCLLFVINRNSHSISEFVVRYGYGSILLPRRPSHLAS